MRPFNNLEGKILSDILMSLASIYGRQDSQFFRTTTGIQSEPDAFHKSRLIMNFLPNLVVG